MAFGKGCHLHLIDGSAFIFRAYHALPPLTRKSDGLPIGAVSGFCNMLQRYVDDNAGPDAPTHVAVIFDKGSHTFRNDMYDQYKANREAMPEDLRPQIPLTRDATHAFNIACEEMEGYEADDIIATLAVQARALGGRCTIISSDKDLMQLVGGGVEIEVGEAHQGGDPGERTEDSGGEDSVETVFRVLRMKSLHRSESPSFRGFADAAFTRAPPAAQSGVRFTNSLLWVG